MNEEPTPPLLSLVQKGGKTFPRYIIAKGNHLRNPVYWNTDLDVWTENENDATLYANINDAAWEQHNLMLESIGDSPCHRYVAPIYLELYGKKPTLDQFREWLEQAIRIVVNTPDYGYGPDGAVGVIVADFSELTEDEP